MINVDIGRAYGVTDLLDLQGAACDQHVPLLKPTCGCVGLEDLLEVSPSFLRRLGFLDIAQHMLMDVRSQKIHENLPLAPMLGSRRCRVTTRVRGERGGTTGVLDRVAGD